MPLLYMPNPLFPETSLDSSKSLAGPSREDRENRLHSTSRVPIGFTSGIAQVDSNLTQRELDDCVSGMLPCGSYTSPFS